MQDDLFASRDIGHDSAPAAISGRALEGGELAELARAGGALHLIDCDLAHADAPELDLTGWSFERCDLRHVRLAGARLERTRWQSCRAAFADLRGADLTDARFVSSDCNNAILGR